MATWLDFALRGAGAFVGAVASLAFLPPASKREFARRSVVALICGAVFGDLALEYAGLEDHGENQFAFSALVALLAWSALMAFPWVVRRASSVIQKQLED